jgi:chromosome segregation ATPase
LASAGLLVALIPPNLMLLGCFFLWVLTMTVYFLGETATALEKRIAQSELLTQSQQKESEIQRLIAELAQAQSQNGAAQLRVQEELTRNKIQAERLEEENQQLQAGMERISIALKNKIGELAAKEEENAKEQARAERLEKEMQRLKVEAAKAGAEELSLKDEEIHRLTSELERINAEHENYEKRIAKLKEAETTINEMEASLDEEKRAVREVKLRTQEIKMKLQLLDDKTKESVELIAQFAQGKEFDEFRKVIHLDEVIQKYEEQIKALKIENLGLEEKLKR